MNDTNIAWLIVMVGILGGCWYATSSMFIILANSYKWLKRKIDLNLADVRTMIVSKEDVNGLFADDPYAIKRVATKFAYRYNLENRTVLKIHTNRKLRLVKIWIKK